MAEIVFIKFNSDEQLKKMLLETGNQELIEGNSWNDTYWGVCKGKGENHLGRILQKVRSQLATRE